MSTYTDLYKRWEQILHRDGSVWVEILGVKYSIEEIGKDDDKIDLVLIPAASMSRCSLLVTEQEFEKLLEKRAMGKVAKIKFLLNILTRDFPNALQSRIVKGTLQPILVSCDVDLPEEYPDGTIVTKDEVEKAVNLFRARLGRIQQ